MIYLQKSTMRWLVLTLMLFFCGSVSAYASDTLQSQATGKEKQNQKVRGIIRGGIGAQGTFSLIFPGDINSYTKDLYGAIKLHYAAFNSGKEPQELRWGYGYSLKGYIRALNLFQLEPYWDHFYTFPLEVLFNQSAGGYAIKATYNFQLSYDEKGVSLLWVPGSKDKNTFLTIGGGFGILRGQFTQSVTGYESSFGFKKYLDGTRTYQGTTNCYHATFGLTFVPWHYLELELILNGRYALIKTLKDEAGVIFTNPYGNHETISLNFSGADLRFGVKFIFP
jgi:hypothetical protein